MLKIFFGKDGKKYAEAISSWEHYSQLLSHYKHLQALKNVRNLIEQISQQRKFVAEEIKGLNLSPAEEKAEWDRREKDKTTIFGQLIATQKAEKDKLLQCNFSCIPNPDGTIKGSQKEAALVFIEFDESEEPIDVVAKRIMSLTDKIQLALLYVSSRKKGLHIIVKRNFKFDYEVQQEIIANICGIKRDKAVKDITRVAYQTSLEDVLYHNDALLFAEPPTPETKDLLYNWDYEGISDAEWLKELPIIDQVRIEKAPRKDANAPLEFQGVTMPEIVKQLDAQYDAQDGEVEVGKRHERMMKMASQIAPLCGNDPEIMAQVLPDYGKPEEEKEAAINYVVANSEGKKVSDFAKLAIAQAKQKAGQVSDMFELPELPTNLPPIIKLFTDGVPERLKPAVAENLFAPLTAHLNTQVKFKYVNGKYTYPCFMNLLVGASSAGKECITFPIQTIMRTIKDTDTAARIAIADAIKKNKKNKAQQVEIPDFPIQEIQPNATPAAFLKRAMAVEKENKSLYMYAPEAENLRKLSLNGKSFPNDIIKDAFDHQLWGAERVSIDAISGEAKLAFNFNASTQPNTAKSLIFGSLLTDGTLQRLNISKITKQEIGAEIESFEGLDDESADSKQAFLQPYLEKIHQANGIIESPEAFDFQKKLLKKSQEDAKVYESLAYDNLRKRALVIGYNKAMLLYIINGNTWSKEIEDYVEWAVNYDLACKMQIFGDAMESKLRAEDEEFSPQTSSRGANTVLQYLPNEFTREEFARCCFKHGCKSDKQMLYNFKKAQLVEQTENGNFRKKSA